MSDLITDHADQAVDNLTYEYKDSAQLIKLIREVLIPEVQIAEELLFSVISERTLDGAVGAQLDQLGDLVGEPRYSLTDDEYRAFIRARIKTNLGEGEATRLIDVLATLVRGARVKFMLTPPASFSIQYEPADALSAGFRSRLFAQVQSLTPAGVGSTLIEAAIDSFGFDDDDDALGFDVGVFAEEITE